MNWPDGLGIVFCASVAVSVVVSLVAEHRAKAKVAAAYAEIQAKRPPLGTKRLITIQEGKRPCRECGKPLDMGDGAVLTQYDDGSLGCAAHAEETP